MICWAQTVIQSTSTVVVVLWDQVDEEADTESLNVADKLTFLLNLILGPARQQTSNSYRWDQVRCDSD